MKDSQDWLDDCWGEWFDGRVEAIYTSEAHQVTKKQFKSAIRKHILQEALEMIGKDDRDYSGDNTDHDSKIFLVASSTSCNELRQELRNKFNDKYKED